MKRIILTILILLPLLAFAQDAGKKKAYFFFLDSCPHCHNVDNYFTSNGIYDKYDIKKLDASIPANGQFLMKLYEANNFPEEQRGGVPVVVFADKFMVGDQPVIDNFVKEIDASSDALQLPNPDKNGAEPDIVIHVGPISSAASPAESAQAGGNKTNYLPVVIAALVVMGAGALIYINR